MAAGIFLFDSAIGLIALVKETRATAAVFTNNWFCLIAVYGSADVQIKVRHARIAWWLSPSFYPPIHRFTHTYPFTNLCFLCLADYAPLTGAAGTPNERRIICCKHWRDCDFSWCISFYRTHQIMRFGFFFVI